MHPHPVAAGLLAALCWGVADWCARTSSRALGAYRAQLWAQLTGVTVLVAVAFLSGEIEAARNVHAWRPWAATGLYAACVGVAALAFFDAFGRGKLVVVAPIVGAYGAVTLLLDLLSGTQMSPQTGAGLLLVLLGVILASIGDEPGRSPQAAPPPTPAVTLAVGVPSAVLSAVLFGVAFFVLGKEVAEPLGALVPTLVSRLLGPLVFILLAPLFHVSTAPPMRGAWGATFFSGLLSSAAAVATAYGSIGDDDAVVAMLGSMSVVVTIGLSLVFTRDRLRVHQWIGVALTLAGIPLLALAT